MGYNSDIYRRIREEYDTKYLRAREAADLRRSEIHLLIPEVVELDREMNGTGLAIMKVAMEGGDYEGKLAELRARNEDLRRQRGILLAAKGYPADYTEVKYDCPLCGDTGYVDCKMCKCMRQKLTKAGIEASGMATLIESQSFDNFSLDYYMDSPASHQAMTHTLANCRRYAEEFEAGKSVSFFFMGGTGLGKTHLSSAIARVVIERGYDVFYNSAVGLLSDFEYQRFGNGLTEEAGQGTSRYFDCDLLIIDDLGTEINNQFSSSVLYHLINTRLNRRQSTIISTNLSQTDFRKMYWDRITSRVLGEYRVIPFYGVDVRAQRLKKKK